MPAQNDRSPVDRRRRTRGGRRATDAEGATPLVLIVGGPEPARNACEAVLAKLRFAVAASESVERAVGLLPDLRPDIVVVPSEEVLRMRSETPEEVRVIVMRDDPELLIGAIRRSLG